MASDDILWSSINRGFCSYKVTESAGGQKFCRNEFNVTGICCRSACPIANSQYATVREEGGRCFLYMRTVERMEYPLRQWQKVLLSKNFKEARKQISEHLVFWKAYFRQKCKQRHLKILQYLNRMRKLKIKGTKKVVPIKRNIDVRTKRREQKALTAAKLDNAIEKQLLERLKQGTYERIYNFPKVAFNVRTQKATEDEEIETYENHEKIGEETVSERSPELVEMLEQDVGQDSADEDSEFSADEDDEGMSDDDYDDDDNEQIEFVADFDESDDDIEDVGMKASSSGTNKRVNYTNRPRVTVECDEDDD